MRALGIRQFIKGFFSVRDQAFGFNTPAKQSGLEGRWVAKPDEANPKRFAFYSVEARHSGAGHPQAVLLDYSRGDNGLPAKLIRDYVVRALAARSIPLALDEAIQAGKIKNGRYRGDGRVRRWAYVGGGSDEVDVLEMRNAEYGTRNEGAEW